MDSRESCGCEARRGEREFRDEAAVWQRSVLHGQFYITIWVVRTDRGSEHIAALRNCQHRLKCLRRFVANQFPFPLRSPPPSLRPLEHARGDPHEISRDHRRPFYIFPQVSLSAAVHACQFRAEVFQPAEKNLDNKYLQNDNPLALIGMPCYFYAGG